MPIFYFYAIFFLTTGTWEPAEKKKKKQLRLHLKVLLVSAAICVELTNIFFLVLALVPKPGATAQTVEAARLSAQGLSQRSSATIDWRGGRGTRQMCSDLETLVCPTVAQKNGKHQEVYYKISRLGYFFSYMKCWQWAFLHYNPVYTLVDSTFTWMTWRYWQHNYTVELFNSLKRWKKRVVLMCVSISWPGTVIV